MPIHPSVPQGRGPSPLPCRVCLFWELYKLEGPRDCQHLLDPGAVGGGPALGRPGAQDCPLR